MKKHVLFIVYYFSLTNHPGELPFSLLFFWVPVGQTHFNLAKLHDINPSMLFIKGFHFNLFNKAYPIPSMYGIFTYICLIFVANAGKYTMHGCYRN